MTVARLAALSASIEVSSKQVLAGKLGALHAPPGTRVYLPDIGTEPLADRVLAAKLVQSLGLIPVPHIAARRLSGRPELESTLARFVGDAGVDDVLLIAGGLSVPAGPFASAFEVMQADCFAAAGLRYLGVAGHPEGSPDFSHEVAIQALLDKIALGRSFGYDMRIVTQFGFDGAGFARWADGLRAQGIDAPVHIGVAGPAKMATLLKYAIACGVGNSLGFLRKRARSLTALTSGHDPEDVARPIETAAVPGVVQLHVYAFGGLATTGDWLLRRGSWHAAEPRNPRQLR